MLNFDFANIDAQFEVDVYSVTGQKLKTVQMQASGITQVDLTNFANGNYFIVIRDGEAKRGVFSINLNK